MNLSFSFRDKNLITIWEKVQNNIELSLEDGMTMFHSNDLISLGKMAHWLQTEKSGDAVYFIVNQKIEPTNICVLSCKFCDFAVKKGSEEAYEHSIEEILQKLSPELLEVHITGGLHPDWPWNYYVDLIREIKKSYPQIDVKAWTAVEIDFFHKKFKKSVEDILLELKEAGLRTLPGGGAEVFSERIRRLLFDQKIGEKRWLEIHKTAHRLGIRSNATLLYGHIESPEERVNHFIKLRDAQSETGGFLSFIPLAFQPGNTGIKVRDHFTSAIDDLKTIAISRLMLNNFDHIKAYWIMLTEQLASVALSFGADDMDGTVGGERIAHDAGAISPMTLAKDKLIKIISDAGKIPVERDINYNPVKLHSDKIIGKVSYLNTAPFFEYLEKENYKIFPAPPRQLGKLFKKDNITAGIISLMDFFEKEDSYEMLDYGIVGNQKVKSVLLFSKYPIEQLSQKTIAVTNETSTSSQLLRVIIEHRYNLDATYINENISAHADALPNYDAFLTIGDDALKFRKLHLKDFIHQYDLAELWYEWKKLPFVFAIWVIKKSFPQDEKQRFNEMLKMAYENGMSNLNELGQYRGKRLGLNSDEIKDYFLKLNYRINEKEKEAIIEFKSIIKTKKNVTLINTD